MWSEPEGKFVRATDYLTLLRKYDCLQIDALAAEHMRAITEEEHARDHIICGRCLNYTPGHATGAGDICDCPRPLTSLKVKDETWTGDITREPFCGEQC